jgi:hypothetical protein
MISSAQTMCESRGSHNDDDTKPKKIDRIGDATARQIRRWRLQKTPVSRLLGGWKNRIQETLGELAGGAKEQRRARGDTMQGRDQCEGAPRTGWPRKAGQ